MTDSTSTSATACPWAGQGGSYTLDPATGLRVLIARTDMPAGADTAVPPAPTIEGAPAKPAKKGT